MAQTSNRRGGLIEGINVTPLVDITLVLLVVFIVTAKILVTPAIPMDLPGASQSEDVQLVFAVAIERSGELALNGKPIELAALTEVAREASGKQSELRAVIQADTDVTHGRVIAILDALKVAGVARVAFGVAPRTDSGAP